METEMSERKYKTVATQTGVVIDGYTGRIFKMKNGLDHKSIGSIEAADYPAGARVTVTIEEPEPPQERIVLPEGMRWDIADLLWTADGNIVASARSGASWYRRPFTLAHFNVPNQGQTEETKRFIENILAENNYFGVRKVMDNE